MLYDSRLAVWDFGQKEACSAHVMEYEQAEINPMFSHRTSCVGGGEKQKVELITRSIFFFGDSNDSDSTLL